MNPVDQIFADFERAVARAERNRDYALDQAALAGRAKRIAEPVEDTLISVEEPTA